jgi:hypothetical protein
MVSYIAVLPCFLNLDNEIIQTVPADFVHVQPLAPCLIGNTSRTAMNLTIFHTYGAYAKFSMPTKVAHCIVL